MAGTLMRWQPGLGESSTSLPVAAPFDFVEVSEAHSPARGIVTVRGAGCEVDEIPDTNAATLVAGVLTLQGSR